MKHELDAGAPTEGGLKIRNPKTEIRKKSEIRISNPIAKLIMILPSMSFPFRCFTRIRTEEGRIIEK
jgi:hypothetical protein